MNNKKGFNGKLREILKIEALKKLWANHKLVISIIASAVLVIVAVTVIILCTTIDGKNDTSENGSGTNTTVTDTVDGTSEKSETDKNSPEDSDKIAETDENGNDVKSEDGTADGEGDGENDGETGNGGDGNVIIIGPGGETIVTDITDDPDETTEDTRGAEPKSAAKEAMVTLTDNLNYLIENEKDKIFAKEQSYFNDSTTDTERTIGYFGYTADILTSTDTVMVPYLADRLVINSEGSIYIDAVGKPGGRTWIRYYSKEASMDINIAYLDSDLAKQGEENGGAWIMSQIDPDFISIENYETKNEEDAEYYNNEEYLTRTVYEKTYELSGEKSVKALVVDCSQMENPSLDIYFVYDNMLVNMKAKPTRFDAHISELKFYGVRISTGELAE